jgi:hypothetical protein
LTSATTIIHRHQGLLSPGGVCYLVVVDDNRPNEILANMRQRGLDAQV